MDKDFITILASDCDADTSTDDQDPIVCSSKSKLKPFDVCYVRKSDFLRLETGKWLNDTLIEYSFFKLLEKSSERVLDYLHIFPTYFYTKLVSNDSTLTCEPDELSLIFHRNVMNWTKKKNIDIFEKGVHVYPINIHSHWYLVIARFPSKTDLFKPFLAILDSSLKTSLDHEEVATNIRNYLLEEIKGNKLSSLESRSINEMKTYYPLVPQQTDGSSCGLFVIHYFRELLLLLSRGSELNPALQGKAKWPKLPKDMRKNIAGLIRASADLFDLGNILPTLEFTDGEVKEKSSVYQQYLNDKLANCLDYTSLWTY